MTATAVCFKWPIRNYSFAMLGRHIAHVLCKPSSLFETCYSIQQRLSSVGPTWNPGHCLDCYLVCHRPVFLRIMKWRCRSCWYLGQTGRDSIHSILERSALKLWAESSQRKSAHLELNAQRHSRTTSLPKIFYLYSAFVSRASSERSAALPNEHRNAISYSLNHIRNSIFYSTIFSAMSIAGRVVAYFSNVPY